MYKTLCKRCYNATPARRKARKVYDAQRPPRESTENRRAYAREYKSRPEVRAKQAERQRVRKESTRRARARNGFTDDLVRTLRAAQNSQCAICGHAFGTAKGRRECADHCHASGTPRGLLCAACNLGLGIYEKYQKPQNLRIELYDAYLATPPARGFL